jgi:DUF1365 family protein
VIPAGADAGGSIDQSCRKELFVSPFNPVEGRYDFTSRRSAKRSPSPFHFRAAKGA